MDIRWIWIMLSINLGVCRGQCDGSILDINGKGTIQSPHYRNESRKSSVCRWRTLKKNSVVVFQLSSLKMFDFDDTDRYPCNNSYKLIIDKTTVNCQQHIPYDDPSKERCFAFRRECDTVPDIPKNCKLENVKWRVKVRYSNSGNTPDGANTEAYGFKMKYKVLRCKKANKSSPGEPSVGVTSSASTTTGSITVGGQSSLVAMIVVVAIIFIIGTGVAFFIRKRKRKESRAPQPQTQEPIDYMLYSVVNDVTATYAEIDRPMRNIRATASQSNHLQATTSQVFDQQYGDQSATPTQQHPIEEQNSSAAVYSQIDRSSKRWGRARESESQSGRDVTSRCAHREQR